MIPNANEIMNPEARAILDAILKKEEAALTESDKKFLRARESYVSWEDKVRYPNIFKKLGEEKHQKEVKGSRPQENSLRSPMSITIKPTEKDRIILKDAGLAVADAIVASIPGLNLPWNLSKALFEAGMKLRIKRAVEWVEMVRDNPSFFPEDLWSDEKFQDGFVVALEKYLVERDEEKRRIFRNIFLGFAKADDKEKFPLEKFTHTLSQLGETDIETLRDVKIDEKGLDYQNYQIYPGGVLTKVENIFNLISLGLLLDVTGNRLGHGSQEPPFVKPTFFCREFVEYLKK